MTRYKMVLQYAGTRYAGWQIQEKQDTIQGFLQEALATLTRETVAVVGAGRTDAGVHALAQTAHFTLSRTISREKLLRGLNGLLPGDIRVTRLARVPSSFHARRDAWKKRYEYRIYNGAVLSPFLSGYVCQMSSPLDTPSMRRAARLLCGRHDFSGFAASSTRLQNRTRTVLLSRLRKRGRHLRYQIEADGFLHHMVRNIVGTLLQVGQGRREWEAMGEILQSKDRRNAGPTAPPQGLYLVRVWYR